MHRMTKPITDLRQMELRVAKAIERHALMKRVETLEQELGDGGAIGSFTGSFILLILSMALYIYTVFRIFSRKRYARQKENERFLTAYGSIVTKIRQFFMRLKLRKEYKYFKCEKCRTLIRLRRGGGEKTVVCPKCGHTFQKKT